MGKSTISPLYFISFVGNCKKCPAFSETESALQLLARAVTPTASHKVDYYDRSEPVQNRLHKSLRLWTMYTDLEESFGTFQTTKAAYDRMIDYRIATPQIIMNYGLFLEEHNYFEEAFKVSVST